MATRTLRIIVGHPMYNRLLALWKDDHKPSTVIADGVTYVVFTPKGDEEPEFVDRNNKDMYSSASVERDR